MLVGAFQCTLQTTLLAQYVCKYLAFSMFLTENSNLPVIHILIKISFNVKIKYEFFCLPCWFSEAVFGISAIEIFLYETTDRNWSVYKPTNYDNVKCQFS